MSEKPTRRRLKNLSDVRKFLADTINRLNQDHIDSIKASKLGYLCSILSKVIVDDSLEKRVAALEQKLDQPKR